MIKNYLNSNNSFLSTTTKNFFFTFLFLFSLSSLSAQNFESVSVTSVASGSGTDNALFNVTSSIPSLVFVRAEVFLGEPGVFSQNGDDIRFSSNSASSGIPNNVSRLRFSFLQADGVTLVPVNDFRFKINDVDGPNNEGLATDCASGVRFVAVADPTNIVLDNSLPDLNATGTATESNGTTSRVMYEFDDVNFIEINNYANNGFLKDFDMDNDLVISTPLYSVCDKDTDNDGRVDSVDLDDDNDGILDTVEAAGNEPDGDNDGDGLPNHADVSDDTGASATYIANADGSTTSYIDADSNGTPDVYDNLDIDNDGIPNHLDNDSDNDGCYDALEGSGGFTLAQVDSNGELTGGINGGTGVPNLVSPGGQTDVSGNDPNVTAGECDDDADGIINSADVCPGDDTADLDGDTIPDGCDPDDDGDGISDVDENLNCAGGTTIASFFFNEDFGTGNRTSTSFTNYCYEDGSGTGACSLNGDPNTDDGEYSIVQFPNPFNVNTGAADFAWDSNGDHTGDPNGRMAVFNASFASQGSGEFYNRTISGLIPNVNVDISLWIKNILLVGENGILPNVTIEIRDLSNAVIFTQNTGDIPENVTWINYTASFDPGVVTDIKFVLINNAIGGVGNDLAIDDISLAQALCDSDNDGVINQVDLDSDNDGIPDLIEGGGDQDGDGILNFLDIDSDGDGIYDVIEAGHGQADVDGDGVIDGIPSDFGNNGLFNAIETDDTGTATINYTLLNSDGDALFDFLDVDDDNDGVNTEFENDNADGDGNPTTGVVMDTDGDGILDYLDTDDDGDGVNTIFENDNADADGDPNTGVVMDTDGDGTLDYIDVDDDGDGVNTEFESDNADADGDPTTGVVVDTDGDGTLDYLDVDDDGDGVNTEFENDNTDADGDPTTGVVIDTDGDGTLDYLDIDDDGDGVNTIFENDNADADGDPNTGVVMDTDGDGTLDYIDVDDDGDGVNTEFESDNADADGDPTTGVVVDTDGDGTLDYLDVDDDGDGVNTEFENDNADADGDPTTGVVVDTDGDGTLDYLDVDDDGDGVNTEFENDNADADGDPSTGVVVDTDGDGTLDYLDVDDDGDGVNTEFESDNADADGDPNTGVVIDTDGDGTLDYLDSDDDGDGVDTIFEDADPNGDNDPADAVDTDGDTIPDYLDDDDDGDGIDTADENPDPNGDGDPADALDSDGDGIPNYFDLDSDNDGILDADETFTDTDGDGIPNYIDLDSDNDGIFDVVEAGHAAFDSNGDGVIDTLISVGTNGLFDALETFPDSNIQDPSFAPIDSSTVAGVPTPDGIFDFLELDSDTDGCTDVIEAGYTDGDADGLLGNSPVATNGNGVVTSGIDGYTTPNDVNSNLVFDFQEYAEAASIANSPSNQVILAGANAMFTVIVNSGDSFSWEESTTGIGGLYTAVVNGGVYSGQGTDNLTLTGVPVTYNGYYYRVVVTSSNLVCDLPATSTSALLTVGSDSDGDLIDDSIDLDDDNDGIPDTDESGGNDPNGDADGDGIPNYLDTTDDGGAGDGSTTDYTDADGNGIPDVYDGDGDGVPNHLDLDSDNDGIYDLVESGQLDPVNNIVDTNNDGIIDAAGPGAVGANGLLDTIETDDTATATVTIPTADSDADGIPDSNEINADNDGCVDTIEAGFTDPDANGLLGNGTFGAGLLVNSNGVVTGQGGYTTPLDGDSNGIFDFQEVGEQVTLTDQPMNQTITINANANFDVTGTSPIYQWQESTDGGGTWNDITLAGANPTYSGFNTDALTLTFVPASYSGNQYRVILSSPAFACGGNITSNAATLTVQSDFDGDGIGDDLDLDDDNDGIPDLVELNGLDPLADNDGDGVPAYLDDNDNNIAVGDTDGIEAAYDLDGDGNPNHLDLDADGDGIYDVNEGGFADLDANDDGVIDGVPADFGTNGLFDGLEDAPDSGVINYTPLDTDNDGIINALDIDDDNDGVNTEDENPVLGGGPGDPANAQDTDGDSVPDYLDIDDDNDGILTATEGGTANDDADSFPNYLDQDADGDGIADNVEGQSTVGYVAPTGNDSDGDGLDDAYDLFDNNTVSDTNNNNAGTNGIQPVDTDSGTSGADGNPDYLDTDTDGDGVPDSIEGHDINNDGVADNFPTTDSDNDGLNDAFDGSIGDFGDPNGAIVTTDPATDLPDTDSTEDVNFRDVDDDGDGLDTQFEDLNGDGDFSNDDTDGDGIPNYLDNDDDGDGILTADEDVDGDGDPRNDDSDGDGIPNYLDDDDDNDGIATGDEDVDGDGDPTNDDSDGDGIPNYLDIDDDNDGIMTIVESSNDEDGDGQPNHLDLDADADGIPDNVEGQTTSGYVAPSGVDSDNDGLDDAYDTDTDGSNQLANFEASNGIQPVNTDSSAVLNSDADPDYLDTDSDGDTVPDSIEGHNFNAEFGPDIEPSGNDIDNDGLDDAYDSDLTGYGDPNGNVVDTNPATDLPNFDGVDEVNYRDIDDDNDGIDTAGEDGDMSGDAIRDDCDEDGNPNYVDVVPCDRVPSGFSPNDDGNNDTFIIPALDQYPNFTMEVYDRWGNRIYDYDNAGREDVLWWDGFSSGSRTIQKGQKVPVGTYYYIINFNQDRISPIAGWVYVNY